VRTENPPTIPLEERPVGSDFIYDRIRIGCKILGDKEAIV
jgi:hypothetical protein